MQIRFSKSGRKIELLRTRYVPEKKRSSQNMAASFDSGADRVPDNVMEKLNNEEKQEVREWLDRRIADRQKQLAIQKIIDFSINIDRVINGISRYGITHDQAQAIYAGIDKLAKSMRKTGFTRLKNN